MTIAVTGFDVSEITILGRAREVYRRGEGPAVIVMAEVPGITEEVASFARRVADAGFAIYLPQLFGTPLRMKSKLANLAVVASVCVSREFRLLAANRSSPIVDWLRGLARIAYDERGGKGVGAIGMCLTGNVALAMMLGAPVIASVLAQPSLPVGPTKKQRAALHASPAEIAAAHHQIDQLGARILGLRFDGDRLCREERFDHLRREFGEAFECIEIPNGAANPNAPPPAHSVLTDHLIDEEGQPTRAALDRTLAFLKEQLAPDRRP